MSTIYQLHIYQLLRNNELTTKVFSILRNKPKFGIDYEGIYFRWLKNSIIEIGNTASISGLLQPEPNQIIVWIFWVSARRRRRGVGPKARQGVGVPIQNVGDIGESPENNFLFEYIILFQKLILMWPSCIILL